MYAEDFRGFLPYSKFTRVQPYQPNLMTILRTGDDYPAAWDGLGVLFGQEYLEAPGVFYCPSHRGDRLFENYAGAWVGTSGEIQGNYQYRGFADMRLDAGDGHALVTDALRTQLDYNHGVGSNVLRSDLGVGWFSDPNRRLAGSLPATDGEIGAASKVEDAWHAIDESVSPGR
jgi:hypothetical protein